MSFSRQSEWEKNMTFFTMKSIAAKYGFAVNAQLGAGSFGKVVSASQMTRKERQVALKFMSLEDGREEATRMQKATKGNECCVELLDHFKVVGHEDTYILVVELCPGGSLGSYTHEALPQEEKLSRDEILLVAYHLLCAVEPMHQQSLVHNDIKPENVLITAEGAVKLADFGTVQSVAWLEENFDVLVGTPNYMPPEAIIGNINTDATPDFSFGFRGTLSDIWSIGVTLYQLVFHCELKPHDMEVKSHDEEIQFSPDLRLSKLNDTDKDLVNLLEQMLIPSAFYRSDAKDLLEHDAFDGLKKLAEEKLGEGDVSKLTLRDLDDSVNSLWSRVCAPKKADRAAEECEFEEKQNSSSEEESFFQPARRAKRLGQNKNVHTSHGAKPKPTTRKVRRIGGDRLKRVKKLREQEHKNKLDKIQQRRERIAARTAALKK